MSRGSRGRRRQGDIRVGSREDRLDDGAPPFQSAGSLARRKEGLFVARLRTVEPGDLRSRPEGDAAEPELQRRRQTARPSGVPDRRPSELDFFVRVPPLRTAERSRLS